MIPFLRKFQNDMSRASERRNERLRRLRVKAKRRSFLEKLEDRHLMAALIVTNGNDSGDGSLRAAIESANSSNEADIITFANNAQTITLTGSVLEIKKDTRIVGPATINLGNAPLQVSGTGVEFVGLEITGAKQGAIRNEAVLLIRDSTIHGNAGDWTILNFATVTIVNSTISNNPGATAVKGDSTFGVSSSTIVVNSIITGNRVGIDGNNSSIRFFRPSGLFTLHNSIVAGNSVEDVRSFDSIRSSSSHNLVGVVTEREVVVTEHVVLNTGNNQNTDGVDVSEVIDTNLKRQDGGNTFVDLRNILTHALVDGSLAIDAGDSNLFTFEPKLDQRGSSRIEGTAIDIGPLEGLDPSVKRDITVTNELDYAAGATPIIGSLRWAIEEVANKNNEAETIVFAPNVRKISPTSRLTLTETGGNKTTIRGPVTIDLSIYPAMLWVNPGVSAEFFGLEITGSQRLQSVVNEGQLQINSSTIYGNRSASPAGRAIHSVSGKLTIVNSTISDNTAERKGSGVYVGSGSASIVNSTITNNRITNAGGDGDGGAIFAEPGANLVIHNSIIAGNLTTGILNGNLVSGFAQDLAGNISSKSSNNLVSSVQWTGPVDPAAGLKNGMQGNIVGNGSQNMVVTTVIDTNLKRKSGGNTFTGLEEILTHALVGTKDSNKAIDAGEIRWFDSSRFTDQIGAPRISGEGVDIGAVEKFQEPGRAILDYGQLRFVSTGTFTAEKEVAPGTKNDPVIFMDQNGTHSSKGSIDIGMIPSAGKSFEPLLHLRRGVKIDPNAFGPMLRTDGVISARTQGKVVDLMSGADGSGQNILIPLSFLIGASRYQIDPDHAIEWQVSGNISFKASSLGILIVGDNSRLRMNGFLSFDALNGAGIELTGGNQLELTATTVTAVIATGSVALRSPRNEELSKTQPLTLKLGGSEYKFESANMQYDGTTKEFKLSGKARVSFEAGHAELEFGKGGDDSYLYIKDGQILLGKTKSAVAREFTIGSVKFTVSNSANSAAVKVNLRSGILNFNTGANKAKFSGKTSEEIAQKPEEKVITLLDGKEVEDLDKLTNEQKQRVTSATRPYTAEEKRIRDEQTRAFDEALGPKVTFEGAEIEWTLKRGLVESFSFPVQAFEIGTLKFTNDANNSDPQLKMKVEYQPAEKEGSIGPRYSIRGGGQILTHMRNGKTVAKLNVGLDRLAINLGGAVGNVRNVTSQGIIVTNGRIDAFDIPVDSLTVFNDNGKDPKLHFLSSFRHLKAHYNPSSRELKMTGRGRLQSDQYDISVGFGETEDFKKSTTVEKDILDDRTIQDIRPDILKPTVFALKNVFEGGPTFPLDDRAFVVYMPVDGRSRRDVPITANYTVSGTARPGRDYTALSGSVQIPVTFGFQDAVAYINVTALEDHFIEGDESIVVTLTSVKYADGEVIPFDPTPASIVIADNENRFTAFSSEPFGTDSVVYTAEMLSPNLSRDGENVRSKSFEDSYSCAIDGLCPITGVETNVTRESFYHSDRGTLYYLSSERQGITDEINTQLLAKVKVDSNGDPILDNDVLPTFVLSNENKFSFFKNGVGLTTTGLELETKPAGWVRTFTKETQLTFVLDGVVVPTTSVPDKNIQVEGGLFLGGMEVMDANDVTKPAKGQISFSYQNGWKYSYTSDGPVKLKIGDSFLSAKKIDLPLELDDLYGHLQLAKGATISFDRGQTIQDITLTTELIATYQIPDGEKGRFVLSGKGIQKFTKPRNDGTFQDVEKEVTIGEGKESQNLFIQNGAVSGRGIVPGTITLAGVTIPTKNLKRTPKGEGEVNLAGEAEGGEAEGDDIVLEGTIEFNVGGATVNVFAKLTLSSDDPTKVKAFEGTFSVTDKGEPCAKEDTTCIRSALTFGGVKITPSGELTWTAEHEAEGETVPETLTISGAADFEFEATTGEDPINFGVSLGLEIQGGQITKVNAGFTNNTKINLFGMSLLISSGGLSYDSKTEEFTAYGSVSLTTGAGDAADAADAGGTDATNVTKKSTFFENIEFSLGTIESPGLIIKEGKLEHLSLTTNAKFTLFSVGAEAKDLSITYSRSDSEVTVTGGLTVTVGAIGGFKGFTATAAFPGKGLLINTETGQVEVRGLELSAEADIGPIHAKASFSFELDDEGVTTISGEGEVTLPGGLTVGAGFELIDGKLNAISVKVAKENPGIQIGNTGVFLTSIEGEIRGFVKTDELLVRVKVTGSLGPSISIFGQTASLVKVSGELTFIKNVSETSLTLKGTVSVLEGFVGEAEGTVKIYFKSNTGEFITIDANMRVLPGGIFQGQLEFKLDRQLNMTFRSEMAVVVPDTLPIIGGQKLGTFQVYMQIRPNDNDRRNDFARVQAEIDLTILEGKVDVTANFGGELFGIAEGSIGICPFCFSTSKRFSVQIAGTGERNLVFLVPDTQGELDGFNSDRDVAPPELTIGKVSLDPDGPGGIIRFTGSSQLPDTTTIELFVDTDATGHNGHLLKSGLAFKEGELTYQWSDLVAFSSVPYNPSEKLYVYGRIYDGSNIPVDSNYSAAITPPNFSPTISLPGEHSFGTNQSLVFSSSKQNAISFSDPLAVHDPDASLVVTLDVDRGNLTLDPQQATPWTNINNATDVDGSGGTQVGDALNLISMLNNPALQSAGGQLPSQRSTLASTPMYDVNGDGKITAADAAALTDTLLNPETATTSDFVAPGVIIKGNGTGRMQLIGTAAAINRMLDGLTYKSYENAFFDDRLELTVNRFPEFSFNVHTDSIQLTAQALTVGSSDGVDSLPLSYEQGSDAHLLRDVRIASAASGHIQSAMIQIDGFDPAKDVLGLARQLQNSLGIKASFDSTTGTLYLTGSNVVEKYRRAIALTTFSSLGSGERTLRVQLGDRASNVAATSIAVYIIAMNQAPMVTTGMGSTYVSGSSTAVSLLPSITVQDTDSATLRRAVITLDADSYRQGEDVLIYETAHSITGRFDAMKGQLVLTGEAGQRAWSAALSSVKYRNTQTKATPGIRKIDITMDDGNAMNSTGHAHQRLLVLAANTALQSAVVGSLPTETARKVNRDLSITLAPKLTLTAGNQEIDSLVRVDVAFTGNFIAGSDFLSTDGLLVGMDSSYDVMNGVLTITGDVPVDFYEYVLQRVSYSNRSLLHDGVARTITFTVFDGFTKSQSKSMTAQFEALPVVQAGMGVLEYTTGQTTKSLDANINVVYAGGMLTGATVKFVWDYLNDQDRLRFTNQNGITGTFDQAKGLLTLTGSATVSQYQAALRSVQYSNTRVNPIASLKQLDVVVRDGNSFSAPIHLLLDVATDVVASEVTATTTGVGFTEGNPPVVVAADIKIGQHDEAHESGRGAVLVTSAEVFIDGYVPGEDVLTFVAFKNQPDKNGNAVIIDGRFDAENGVLSLSGRATPEQYQSVLRSVRYQNVSAAPTTHSRVLKISVSQGSEFSDAPPITVTVTSLNDAPIRIVAPPASATLLENAIHGSLGLGAINYTPPSPQQPYLVLTVSSVPAASLGSIELTRASGVVVAAVGGVYTLAEIRSAVFVPALNASGNGTFVFTVAGFNPILSQPDPSHLTESIRINVAGVEGLSTATMVYDFDKLADGSLIGQDGWTQVSNVGGSMTVTSGVVSAAGDNQQMRPTNFGLSGDNITVTAQLTTQSGINGWQFGILHSGGTSAGGDFVFAVGNIGKDWRLRSAGFTKDQFVAGTGAAEITSTLQSFDVRLEIDLAASSGSGSAKLFVNDVFVLEQADLGLSAANLDPATWTGIHLRHAGGATLDSLTFRNGQAESPGAAFVAQVFRDLLGRNATQQELDALDSKFVFAELSDKGLREGVVAAVRGSREYGQRVVTKAYNRLLGRAPTQAEIERWLGTEKIVEDFADGLLPATLQLSDPDAAGAIEFRNGAVIFSDQFGAPFSLRTVDSNILKQNFTAEVTVSIPSSELGFFGTADSPQTVDVVGNTAYVVYGTGVLRVLDVSNPSNIVELGFFDTPGFLGTLQVVGNKAYVGGSNGLRVLDVSNPANITELGFFVVLSSPRALQVVGNNAYVADQFGLRVLDVSDPANISELGSFATPSGYASDVQVIGDIAYVVITRTSLPDSVSGLRVLNISDPTNISELGFFGTDQAMRLQVIDSTAYIADLLSGLRVLDVSNPASISQLGFFVTGDFTLDVKVLNRTAYVTGLAGFQVLDVSNPANISKFASFDLAGRPNDWQFIGSTAYVAVGGDGLRVLDVPSVEERDKRAAYFGLETADGLANKRLRVAPNQDSSVDVSFFIDSASSGGAGTHRLQLRWNASNQTAVFAIDEDYAGGDFVADYRFYELSANINLEHVYFGSGAGTSFDDFAISFESPPNRLDEVNNHILSSPEYFFTLGGGSFETFVQAAFDDLVNREPTAKELDEAVSLLRSGTSPSDIARQIEFSDQATGIVADQMFGNLLRRTGNRFETVDTARKIQALGSQAAINGMVASTEYYVRYGTQTSGDSRSTEEIEATNAELIRHWLEGTPTVGNSQVTNDFDAVGTISTDGRAHGGGTLIASQYVLTAAHLVEGKDINSLTFSVGLTSYGLEQVYVHPDYLRKLLGTEDGNDIAILKLNRPVVDVAPASLWVGDLYAGDSLTLVGFGPHPGDVGFGTKRSGTTPIDGLTHNLVTWTYDGEDETTTVPGDSGSPQFLKQGDTYYVTSLTSGGTHQALSLGDFAYNTRVSSYSDWIDSVTNSQVTRSASEGQDLSFTASSVTRPIFPSSFVTFNNQASVELSGNDLLIQDISTTGDDNAFYISTTATHVVISDAHQKMTTSITGTTGSNTHTITVPLSSFTGNIVVRSAGGNDRIDVTTPSRRVNIDAGDGQNSLIVNGSDAAGAEEFFVRNSSTVAGSLEVAMPTTTSGGAYIVQATRVHSLELNTGSGNDTVRPQDLSGLTTPLVNFSINLGDGDDVLHGTNGTIGMIVDGEEGNDSLIGGTANDQLTGSFGNDSLAGGPGDDTYVFDADDFLGADTIAENPGAGSDTLDFSPTAFNSIGLDLRKTVSPQAVTTNNNLLITLSENVENVTGGLQGNAIIGNAGVNILRGGNGVDYIIGGGGADQIFGVGSADILHGSSESQIDGGEGADLTEFSGAAISFPNNLSPVFVLSGIVPGTNYDQVRVSGVGRTVTLGGNLEVSLDNFVPQIGNRFTIVDLQGATSVIRGTFNHDGKSLAEGDTFTADGHRFRISYIAGDGNDISLTHVERLPGADTVKIPKFGDVDVIIDGNDVVVRQKATELLRKPGSQLQLQGLRLTGTAGDDTYNIANLAAVYTGLVGGNAGAGYDTLRLTGSGQALDLTSISNELREFEMIDIIGGGNNSLKLDVNSVLAISQATRTLRVQHDESGILDFGGGWNTEKPEIVDTQFVHVLRQDNAKIEIVTTRPYHNPLRALDIDDDGSISLLDVLVVINRINREGLGGLATPTSIDQTPFFYFDTNRDGFISPLDVLIVINFINNQTKGAGGEAISVPFMPPVVSQNVSRVDAVSRLNSRVTSAEGEFVAMPSVAIAGFTQFVYGGSGNDHVRSGESNDMLVEKSSKDNLQVGCDNDLLNGGSTKNQDDLASLDAALMDWHSSDSALALFDLRDFIDEEDLKGEELKNLKGEEINMLLDGVHLGIPF